MLCYQLPTNFQIVDPTKHIEQKSAWALLKYRKGANHRKGDALERRVGKWCRPMDILRFYFFQKSFRDPINFSKVEVVICFEFESNFEIL